MIGYEKWYEFIGAYRVRVVWYFSVIRVTKEGENGGNEVSWLLILVIGMKCFLSEI